ncbi:C-X-C chemokine receptor type 3-like [Latimeria chalumnae]|uniref:C-X-C chemokine receptor type 3 n=1 Tax=Latimeria chalumnae TaxID=7897 RepID=H3B5C7_LATCH|nr:PREDICTED: C-X-C chemokine receptor type 3-like [Latimeria chalumnae]|eukprot:XP_005999214.1 PREDICTED: C-X-C chemokine receptor type 3-like [Latimeria chalumnae]
MEVTKRNAYEFDADWFTENNITFGYDDNYTDDGSYDTCCAASPCDSNKVQSFEEVFLPVFYSLIFLVGVIGNTMVMSVLLKYKRVLAITDTYILHLAVADILMVATLPFWAVEAVHKWIFGTAACKIIGSVFKINFYSGIFLLGCISFDRYLSIVHAVQMYKKRKSYSVHLSCFVVWAFCFLLTIPDMIYLESTYVPQSKVIQCIHNFNTSSARYWRNALRFNYHIIGFIIPFCIMVYCYMMIFKTLSASQGFQKQKALRVVVAVVVAFFLCWAPYNLTLGVDTLIELELLSRDCDMEFRLDISKSVTSSLGYFHCCLNPFLYAFIGVKFRNKFLEIMSNTGCVSQEFVKKYMKSHSRRNSTWSESAETSYSGL